MIARNAAQHNNMEAMVRSSLNFHALIQIGEKVWTADGQSRVLQVSFFVAAFT